MELYSEVETLFGGNLLEEVPQMWGHESLLGEKVDISTCFMSTAPKSYEEAQFSPIEVDDSIPSPTADWETSELDLSIFDDFVNTDFSSIVDTQKCSAGFKDNKLLPTIGSSSVLLQPLSPTGSYDSGVSSPGSADISVLSESGSPSTYSDSMLPLEYELLPTQVVNVENLCSLLPPQETSVENAITEEFLSGLGIELVVEENAVVPEPSVAFTPSNQSVDVATTPVETMIPSLRVEDTSELASLLASSNVKPAANVPFVQDTVTPPVLIPPKSKSGRKSKITNAEEKKQRKRDQNKNAATRYRERKRQQCKAEETEKDRLADKNKMLTDKVLQITKEIDYLKELMIEVYTIKGLISK